MDRHRLTAALALWFLATAALAGADPISLTGKVLDGQGKALPGARAELAPLAAQGRTQPAPVGSAATDGSGTFSLVAPDAGMWTVRVQAPGFVPGRVDLIPLLEARELPPVELQKGTSGAPPPPAGVEARTARPPGCRAGRVLDRLTGKPIAGAFVWPREDPGAAVRTDRAGIYTLVDPPAGELDAAAVRYLPAEAVARRQVTGGLTGPDFLLSPGAAVAGAVVDSRGRPLPEVELEAVPAGSLPMDAPGAPRRVRSDAKGRFAIGGLDPALSWTLRAIRPGFLPGTLSLGNLKPLALKSDLRIVLRPGRPAFGRVIDEAGRPLAGVEVSLLPAEQAGWPEIGREQVAQASSDAKGRFTLDMLPAARVDLEARARGYAPILVRGLTIPPGEKAFDLGSVVLPAGERVEGYVESPDGQPLEGVEIHVERTDLTAARLTWAGLPPRETGTVTGADGRFELDGLKAGEPVILSVSRQGYGRASVPGLQPPLDEPVRVVLSPASRLAGRVLNEKNDPVVAALVLLRREHGMVGMGHTDGEGRFTLETLPAGRFTLDTSAQGYLPGRRDGIEIAAGSDPEDLEIVLLRGAALEGTVQAPDGNPAVGARVWAMPAATDGFNLLSIFPEARTDGDGRYRLEGLGEGKHSVSAEHPAHRKATREIEIREDETRLDLRLGEGWEVAGRAVDGSGRGIAGVKVGLMVAEGGERETLSGPDGAFGFTGIGDGRHQLRAEKQGYARLLLQQVQVSGGPVRHLELRLESSAAVTGQIRGLPFQDLARVQVSAAQVGIPNEQAGLVDHQGSYRIEDLAPGDWIASARLPDGRRAQGRVTIAAGAREAVVDLDFESGLSLSGRVLSGTQAVPAAFVHLQSAEGLGGVGRCDPRGEFRIEGIRPGLYTLRVIAPEGGVRHEETLDLQTDRQIVIEMAAPPPALTKPPLPPPPPPRPAAAAPASSPSGADRSVARRAGGRRR